MIYQFPESRMLFVIGVDLLLIGWIYGSTIPRRKALQRVLYGTAVLAYLGWGVVKLLFTVPHPIPSTPADLMISSSGDHSPVYYLEDRAGETTVFWRDRIAGNSTTRTFDLESPVANGLGVAARWDGEWYVRTLRLTWDSLTTLTLDKSHLTPDHSGEVERAIADYRRTELGNGVSHLLTLAFLGLVFWRTKQYGI